MNLDELKRQWEACDVRLTAGIRLNVRLLRESRLHRIRGSLRGLTAGIVAELVVGAAALLLLGGYIAGRFTDPWFLIPALALHLAAIAGTGFCVHQLVALRTIDYAGPVLVIQRRFGVLHRQRTLATMWTFIAAPLLWTPLLIVAFDGLFGVNAYTALPSAWLAGHVVLGLVAIPAVPWAARRFARRFGHRPWMKQLLDDIGGKSLSEASAYIDELASLEQELIVA